MTSALAEAQQRCIDASPMHRWLDLRLERFDLECVVALLPFRPEFVADPASSYIHGGVIASALDATAEMAITAHLGVAVPTIDLRVDFLRAASPRPMRLEARVERLGRSIAVVSATASYEPGRAVALGRVVFHTTQGPIDRGVMAT